MKSFGDLCWTLVSCQARDTVKDFGAPIVYSMWRTFKEMTLKSSIAGPPAGRRLLVISAHETLTRTAAQPDYLRTRDLSPSIGAIDVSHKSNSSHYLIG